MSQLRSVVELRLGRGEAPGSDSDAQTLPLIATQRPQPTPQSANPRLCVIRCHPRRVTRVAGPRLGHHVEEAAPKVDHAALGRAVFTIISASIAADLRARVAATGIVAGPEMIETVTRAFYDMGTKTTGVDFAQANNDLQAAAASVAEFMNKFDILLSPTLASPS